MMTLTTDWVLSECERLKEALEESRAEIQRLHQEYGAAQARIRMLGDEVLRLQPLAKLWLRHERQDAELAGDILEECTDRLGCLVVGEVDVRDPLFAERGGKRFKLVNVANTWRAEVVESNG